MSTAPSRGTTATGSSGGGQQQQQQQQQRPLQLSSNLLTAESGAVPVNTGTGITASRTGLVQQLTRPTSSGGGA